MNTPSRNTTDQLGHTSSVMGPFAHALIMHEEQSDSLSKKTSKCARDCAKSTPSGSPGT